METTNYPYIDQTKYKDVKLEFLETDKKDFYTVDVPRNAFPIVHIKFFKKEENKYTIAQHGDILRYISLTGDLSSVYSVKLIAQECEFFDPKKQFSHNCVPDWIHTYELGTYDAKHPDVLNFAYNNIRIQLNLPRVCICYSELICVIDGENFTGLVSGEFNILPNTQRKALIERKILHKNWLISDGVIRPA